MEKAAKKDVKLAGPPEGVVEDPAPKPKVPEVSKEEAEALAKLVLEVDPIIRRMDVGVLRLALRDLERRHSNYQALGVLLDPGSMGSTEKRYEQGKAKLEALISFREACELSDRAALEAMTERSSRELLRGLF